MGTTVKQSIVTSLLLLFVALGLPGAQMLALMTAPALAAQEDVSAEDQEERMVRRSASRASQTRGKTARQPFIILRRFIGSASKLARRGLRFRSFLQSNFSTDSFQLLPVYRI